MSSKNRKSTLEDLSAELFYEIFDYFHFHELYNSFSNINRRIDDYLAQLSNISIDVCPYRHPLTTINLNKKQISNVKSMEFNIWNEEEQHVIPEFFIQYSLQLFQQLRSLTLWSISSDTELPLIVNQLPLLSFLTFLNIEFKLFSYRSSKSTINDFRHACETVICHCITLKTLKLSIYDNLDPRKRIHNEPIFTQSMTTNIKHFHIRKIYFDEFDCILSPVFLPQVKSLDASLYFDRKWKKFHNNGLILDYLVNLRIYIHVETIITYIESILKRVPNLRTLSISSDQVTFIDCQKWEYFVSKYLQRIEAFHLSARDYDERDWSKSRKFLDFQTSPYWSTERAGIVQIKCEQVSDELGNEMDFITVIFTTMTFKQRKYKDEFFL